MSPSTLLRSIVPAALLYFAAAALSLSFNFHVGGHAFLWTPTALMIASLTILPRRQWAWRVGAFLIASYFANGLFGVGWQFAAVVAVCDNTEGLIAAYCFSRARFGDTPIGSLPWLIRFVGPVAILAPLVVATPMMALTLISGKGSFEILPQILVGHALGNITFTPMALMLFREGLGLFTKPFTGERRVETMSLLGLVTFVAATVFTQTGLPLLFLPMVPLILVSFRLGYGATMLGVIIVGTFGSVLTTMHMGPIELIHGSLSLQLLFLQFFLTATVVTALPVAADLEGRGKLLDAMRTSEERYRMLAEYGADMLLQVNANGVLVYASPAVDQIIGVFPDDVIGKIARRMVPLDQRPAFDEGERAVRAAGGRAHSFEYQLTTTRNGRVWVESRARALFDHQGEFSGTIAVVRDVTERKLNELKMHQEAMTDVLTGLNNRRAFLAEVEQRETIDKLLPDCVALLDIDRFKRVNDRFGHDAGDAVLANFAKILRQVVRREDVIARLGGEEFVILFPATAIPQALMICERLRLEMAKTITEVGGVPIAVTVSGGVSLLGPRGISHALKEADLALYAAKRGGRDQMALAA